MCCGHGIVLSVLVYAGVSLFILVGPFVYLVVCVIYAYNLARSCGIIRHPALAPPSTRITFEWNLFYQRVFIGLLIKFKVQVQNLVLTVISLCDLKLDLIMFEPHYVKLNFFMKPELAQLFEFLARTPCNKSRNSTLLNNSSITLCDRSYIVQLTIFSTVVFYILKTNNS